MNNIKEIIESQAKKLENAKSKEELGHLWAETKTLATKHNPENKNPNCLGCEILNNICRKV